MQLKLNQKYIEVRADKYMNTIEINFYVCDYKNIWQWEEYDWNCDNDIYKLYGQWMKQDRKDAREFITKDNFDYNFYEYQPQNVLILDTQNMNAYDKMQKIKTKDDGTVVYLTNNNYDCAVFEKDFNNRFKFIEILEDKTI